MMRRLLPLLACLLMGLAGCGAGTNYKVVPVSGQVLLDGTPLPGALVRFEPIQGSSEGIAVPSVGQTDPGGKFTLSTFEGKRGAMPGKHRISITTIKVEPQYDATTDDREMSDVVVPEVIPSRYHGPSSTLEFVVPAGGTSEANFELTSS